MGVKGVIVAAGYGSRFLPVTRVVPKELLPIVDRPAIDFVVQEFADAGIEDVLVITSRRKKALDDWFDRDVELERAVDPARLGYPRVRAQFVRQTEMKGTGHALLLARAFAGSDPFVVAFPDDLFAENCSKLLIDEYHLTGRSVLATGDLSGEDVSRYGVVAVRDAGDRLAVTDIVEKPPKGTEPSSIVSWGRYLYTPELFPALDEGLRGHLDRSVGAHPGEYYATDAIRELARRDRVVAKVIPGARYDTGDRLGYLTTVLEHALAHPELGEPLRAWIRSRV
ncbi:MAG: UTP--glucose-1-phosphate uridylyltransferase [Myxococcota bacterium]